MTRVKKAVNALKNRRSVLRQAKGFRFRRSNTERAANEALAHAGAYSFAHRRDKKGDFRRLWNVRINAGLRAIDPKLSYSKWIGAAKKQGIAIDRKILAELAASKPEAFKKIVASVKA
ncbi:MAG: 50S ribosomal protein L20 [Patescibacteria group bacterium]|nr:50S ribosomal protein L20 [Patescibacteria group bacterium]